MADEIKKVVSVDLGNTATSLREYKKHIDDLRGSLLQLDETSEDYNKIAQEITTEQNKLNEVMKVGKGVTDAAEGSYNQLAQTMSELKKQWKATADEAERDQLGKQILDINNQLKELDASTGNYQRNVGDYANAFETAFGKCLDGITSLDGPLGEIGGDVKNMIPIIKNINKTATAGLSGIKKGIASTGIGILVIAVGELITHWDDLRKIVGISDEQMAEFKETAINTLKNIVSGVVGVGNAIFNFLSAPLKSSIESFKGLGNIVKDVFSGEWSKIKEDAENAFEAIKGIGQKAIDFKGNYEQGKEIANNLIAGIEEILSSKDTEDKVEKDTSNIGKSATKGVSKGAKEEAVNSQKIIEDAWSGMFKIALDNALKELSEEAKRRSDWLKNSIQEAVDESNQELFDLKYTSGIEDAQVIADKEYEIERDLIQKKIDLQKTYIEEFIGTQEEKEAEIKRLAKLELELENANAKHNYDVEQKKKKDRETALNSSLAVAGNVFGALSDLMEEGSKEQKAFAVMETVINTLSGAIAAYKSMAGIPYVGPILGAAAAAAVGIAGAANIAKINSTNKNTSSSSVSVATPQISTPTMTEVTPLLDETADLNRIEMSGTEGDSDKEQKNIRVYVVDQDIRDANNKAEVVENNATF